MSLGQRKNTFSLCSSLAVVAQLVERSHGKGEVVGSIPTNGSIKKAPYWGDISGINFFGKNRVANNFTGSYKTVVVFTFECFTAT
jgi:hypothetical protein